jgi:hypothetical protein
MSALEIIDQVPEFARLVALELKRNLEPHEDEISQNEAWKRYGRGWIVKLTERGLLHPICHANKRCYSISECERMKAKENVVARLATH